MVLVCPFRWPTIVVVGVVRIPQVQPERAIVPQYPPHLAEDFNGVLDVQFRRWFQAEASTPRTALTYRLLLHATPMPQAAAIGPLLFAGLIVVLIAPAVGLPGCVLPLMLA